MQRRVGGLFLLCVLLSLSRTVQAQRLREGSSQTRLARFLLWDEGGSKQSQEEEKARIRQRLGITATQQKQIETLFAETGRQRRALRSRLHSLYQELESLYDAYDFDPKRETALRADLLTQQQRLLTLTADNETKLRRILTRDQFARLRAELKNREKQEREHREPDGKTRERSGKDRRRYHEERNDNGSSGREQRQPGNASPPPGNTSPEP